MILLKYQIDYVTFHLQTLQRLQNFSRVKVQIFVKMCKTYDVSALVLLSSLSLLTPALPPSFQFPHKLIHSEPWYLFIPVVRMPFLKYLYREDISLSFSRCRLSLRLPLFKDSLITVLSLLPDILISLFFCMIITRTVYFLTLHISH